jgi:predicted CoA-substrate-specific enzyme activase
MTEGTRSSVAGVDVGTEYVKALVLGADAQVLGRAVVPTRGYFEACAYEALAGALDDAQRASDDLAAVCATGFASKCVAQATLTATEAACHARGAFHHLGHPMTLIAIGGRDAHVIQVNAAGGHLEERVGRRCALGIGSFLMYSARHLDVAPARLQELAAVGERPATVSSYCSVFSSSELLERLREGVPREEVALGCLHSIAERVVEIGGFEAPVAVCGGVAEYFPGVLTALETLSGLALKAVPEPSFTAALGAALKARGR